MPAEANTPRNDSASSSDLRLDSGSMPTQTSAPTPEARAPSTTRAGSSSTRNRWQWVSTAPPSSGSGGFTGPPRLLTRASRPRLDRAARALVLEPGEQRLASPDLRARQEQAPRARVRQALGLERPEPAEL